MISGPVDFVLALLLLFSHSPFSQGTTPWLDYKNFHVTRFSLMKQISDIVESAMNPTCASNVMEFLCHTWFKECTPFVGKSTGNQLWLPSPLCRSECERHWNVWNECVGALETDEDLKNKFDAQMQSQVAPSHVQMHTIQLACREDRWSFVFEQVDTANLGVTIFFGEGLYFFS
jgi:hypothetical protein